MLGRYKGLPLRLPLIPMRRIGLAVALQGSGLADVVWRVEPDSHVGQCRVGATEDAASLDQKRAGGIDPEPFGMGRRAGSAGDSRKDGGGLTRGLLFPLDGPQKPVG